MQRSEINDIKGKAVTVGTFDGVHRGHREVIEYLLAESRRRALSPMVITFEPHPLAVVAPERSPLLLESAAEREDALRATGAEVVVLPFTEELRRQTVDQWFSRLSAEYGVKLLVAGFDNTFGSDGMMMNLQDYIRIGEAHGIEVIEAPRLRGVSSTLIRRALGSGDVACAAEMLGHPFALNGTVTPGRGLGRTIGVPTANLQLVPDVLIPAPGVYSAEAITQEGARYLSVVNIGVAPTVGKGLPMTIEAHLLDFEGDLYGETLRLEFLRRLRDERKFDSLDELKLQIVRDAAEAKI